MRTSNGLGIGLLLAAAVLAAHLLEPSSARGESKVCAEVVIRTGNGSVYTRTESLRAQGVSCRTARAVAHVVLNHEGAEARPPRPRGFECDTGTNPVVCRRGSDRVTWRWPRRGARAAAADTQVVLGAPDYMPNGEGWGTPAPASIFNGGAPSGGVADIIWTEWGSPVASGVGHGPIYKPQGGYYAARARVLLRASDIGTCASSPNLAYRLLEVRVPPWPGAPPGPWFKWSGTANLCDGTGDPAYEYPHYPPGLCGNVGDDYEPGDLLDVRTYRISCKRGRALARKAQRATSPHSCTSSRYGCVRRVGRFRCRYYPLRDGETTIDLGATYPVRRMACERKKATVTWWTVVWW